MTKSLTIIAGPSAKRTLLDHGFKQELFNVVVSASGGPKWFILFGLDKALYGDFFSGRRKPIHTLGSSAGGWQLGCFARKDPVAAISLLADLYSNEEYSERPTVDEISQKAQVLLDTLLGDQGAAEIANNPVVHTHILADRSRGLVASENKALQIAGLGWAALTNAISRRWLKFSFERLILHSGPTSYFQFSDFPTHYAQLQENNVEQALLATGAIPLILKGVKDIPNAPRGCYRDGGIIDYHFDVPFGREGLVLYPHFAQTVTPGWFDKKLKNRQVNPRHYDNVVLLTPSKELVSGLPYGKISDRTDFKTLDAATRKKYWQQVLSEGHRMAEEFLDIVEKGIQSEQILDFR